MKIILASLILIGSFDAFALAPVGNNPVKELVKKGELTIHLHGPEAHAMFILLLQGGHPRVFDEETGIVIVHSDSVLCSSSVENKIVGCSMTLDKSGRLKQNY